MRLPGMRRARARPRRPRGHPALLMVADQGPPIATHPPHTSASASTPALVRLRKACCCCCSAALLLPLAVASAAAAVVLLLRRHRVAASSMLRQVPEHGACTCARRAWRLWAARHSQGEVGPLGAPPLPWVLAPSHLQSRRFHLPPLTTQEPGGRILRRGGRPLRGSPARAAGRRAACGMKHGPVSPCTVVCCREGSYRAPVELRTLKLMSNTGYLTADLPQSQRVVITTVLPRHTPHLF